MSRTLDWTPRTLGKSGLPSGSEPRTGADDQADAFFIPQLALVADGRLRNCGLVGAVRRRARQVGLYVGRAGVRLILP